MDSLTDNTHCRSDKLQIRQREKKTNCSRIIKIWRASRVTFSLFLFLSFSLSLFNYLLHYCLRIAHKVCSKFPTRFLETHSKLVIAILVVAILVVAIVEFCTASFLLKKMVHKKIKKFYKKIIKLVLQWIYHNWCILYYHNLLSNSSK